MINRIELGYIGLPTALMFASQGAVVVGSDYTKQPVKILRTYIKFTKEETDITINNFNKLF